MDASISRKDGTYPYDDSLSQLPQTPLFVSVPQAAKLLGLGLTYTWSLVNNKTIYSKRFGKRVLIPYESLVKLAAVEDEPDGHN